ncbi:MAG: hypothetical protein IKH61_07885 [Bacteroidales bacterium]|nr:hypothetical protein [Bacteroidales bacterium]
MKDKQLTKYLAIFLLVCIMTDGILLYAFSEKPWWNNWMIMMPNLYMILGAFYCHLMKKNVDTHPGRLTWNLVYKGIKMLLTIAALVLYIVFVKQGAHAFVLITAATYLIALSAETTIYTHYLKHKNNKA